MSTISSQQRKILLLIILLSAIMHLGSLYLGSTSLKGWAFTHIPLHSVLETIGSMVALFVAYLLIMLQRRKLGTSFNCQISSAMIVMGIFDGLHAMAPPGQLFVWLHSLATFFGGLFFLMAYLPRSISKHIGIRGPLSALAFSLIVGVTSITFPEMVPQMLAGGQFTSLAVALNLIGGSFMLLAAVKLFLTYRQEEKIDDLLFILHCTMFGFAAILFQVSALWDVSWWGWHVLRFAAYGVALWFALRSDISAQLALEKSEDYLSGALADSQKSLKASQVRSQAIIDNITDAILISDNEGKVIFSSQEATNLFGYTSDQLIGKDLNSLVPQSFGSDIQHLISKWGNKKNAKTINCSQDLTGLHKDETFFPVECMINAMMVEDEIYILALMRDISERKAQESLLTQSLIAAEKANESKSQFLANMSHEIRTPMNAIMAALQMVIPKLESTDDKALLKNAFYASENLLTIINDILDLSKIEKNQLKLDIGQLDLTKILNLLQSEMSLQAMAKGIDFKLVVEADVPALWQGDAVRLRQILVNIVNNAVKFTDQGTVVITVSVDYNHTSDNTDTSDTSDTSETICGLRFTVADTGIGMSADAMDKLFLRFEQADATITRRLGGTGLGMAITLSLVKMMQGEIDADSVEGQGTTFTLALPLTVDKDNKQICTVKSEEASPVQNKPAETASPSASLPTSASGNLLPIAPDVPDLSLKTLLVAEDNPVNLMVIKKILSATGATVHSVSNGLQALDWLDGHEVDGVLMDIHMPEMDGLTATKKLHSQGFRPPVFAFTANVMAEDCEEYLQNGFSAIMSKPLNIDHVYHTLEKYLLMDSLSD